MMKTVKVQLLALLAIFAFSAVTVTACGGKKEDKGKTEKKAGGDKADGDKADDVDVCAKALKCKDGLIKAAPDQAKNFESAWKFIETLEGDKKIEQCKQLLQGAGFNPKAPPECK